MAYDTDLSGTLNPAEFKNVMKKIGCDLTEDEEDILFRIFDPDNNGLISYGEFVDRYLMQGSMNT